MWNHAVSRNIARAIWIAMPARCAHLMPQEGANRDEECGAHKKGWRKHTQILEHRAHLPSARHDLCRLRPVWVPPGPGWVPPGPGWVPPGPGWVPSNGPAGCRQRSPDGCRQEPFSGRLRRPADANERTAALLVFSPITSGTRPPARPRRPRPRWFRARRPALRQTRRLVGPAWQYRIGRIGHAGRH
jgi:hypothetical protein